jgi:hypothetical protein
MKMLWKLSIALVVVATTVLGQLPEGATQANGNITDLIAPKLRMYENPDKSGARQLFNKSDLKFPIAILQASSYRTLKVKINGKVGWISLGHVETDVKRSTVIPCEGQIASGSGNQTSQGLRGAGGSAGCR